jgi:hypothetical protein
VQPGASQDVYVLNTPQKNTALKGSWDCRTAYLKEATSLTALPYGSHFLWHSLLKVSLSYDSVIFLQKIFVRMRYPYEVAVLW